MDHRTFLLYLLQIGAFRYISRYFGFFNTEKLYLMDQFKVAGYQFYDGDEIINSLDIGDILDLNAEPENEHDKNAIRISLNDIKIGYVPMVDNKLLFELVQNGLKMHCVVFDVEPEEDPWNRLTVQVYLEGDTYIAS